MLKVAEAQPTIKMPWFVELHHPAIAYEHSFDSWREAQKFAASIYFLQKHSHNTFWREAGVKLRPALFSVN